MSALAYQYTEETLPRRAGQVTERNRSASRPAMRTAKSARRGLPKFPGEELCFEAKSIDNSMVVRADDPAQNRSGWRALGAVVTGALVFTGLMLPGAYRMVAGMQIHQLRGEQDQLRREIAELRTLEARHTNTGKLEELARNQELIDPAPQQVQHLTPKGAYAMLKDPPSGK
jgi:hypothetical protein